MKIDNILKDTCIVCTPDTDEREQTVEILERHGIMAYGLPYNAPKEYNIVKVYPRFVGATTYNIIAYSPKVCEEVQAVDFIAANKGSFPAIVAHISNAPAPVEEPKKNEAPKGAVPSGKLFD